MTSAGGDDHEDFGAGGDNQRTAGLSRSSRRGRVGDTCDRACRSLAALARADFEALHIHRSRPPRGRCSGPARQLCPTRSCNHGAVRRPWFTSGRWSRAPGSRAAIRPGRPGVRVGPRIPPGGGQGRRVHDAKQMRKAGIADGMPAARVCGTLSGLISRRMQRCERRCRPAARLARRAAGPPRPARCKMCAEPVLVLLLLLPATPAAAFWRPGASASRSTKPAGAERTLRACARAAPPPPPARHPCGSLGDLETAQAAARRPQAPSAP